MASVQEFILIFTKYPQAGTSKTRMIPLLGNRGAAMLQKKMTSIIVSTAKSFTHNRQCRLEIFHQGGTSRQMQNWLGESLSYNMQHPGNLGAKMYQAIADFQKAGRSIVLIGSDCPEIDADILESAFTALISHHIVLGPAYDGGYYLIGVQGNISPTLLNSLFTDIDWGSKNVLAQTLTAVETSNLNCHLLKKLHDIDTPEDLKYFDHRPYAE